MKQVEALNPLEGLDSEAEEKRKQLEEEFSYDGYKYVRGELFANLREPAITIRNGNITFNTACINGLENVVYVNLMINEDMKRLVVKGCSENDKEALRWCVAKPDKRKSRKMTCPDFTKLLYDMMGWEKCYRYKVIGYKIVVDGETLYVFDLTVHKIFQETKKIKGNDGAALAETGNNAVSKPDRKGFYPEDIANTFGIPVEEHKKMMETEVSLDGFISIGAITGRGAADQETDNSATTKPKSKSKDEKSIQLEDKG